MPAILQDTSNLILPILAVSAILLIWNILLQISVSRMKKNQKIMFSGESASNLEKIILKNKTDISRMDKEIHDLYEITRKIHGLAHKGIHKASLLRFNPFRDLGGDQSFSLSLLDGDDNGVVISSLYSREGVRVYAKSIKNGQAVKYPLTEEEKHVLKTASISK